MTYAAHLQAITPAALAGLNAPEKLTFTALNKKLAEQKLFSPALQTAAANWLGLPLASLPATDIPAALLEPLTLPLCKTNLFLPLSEENGSITCAMANPARGLALADSYAVATGKAIALVFMAEDDLLALINRTFDKNTRTAADVMSGVEAQTDTNLSELTAALSEPEDLLDREADAPIIRLINSILTQALKEGASDIHIEPFDKQVHVRFRVDGVMHTVVSPSKKLHAAMCTRLKVMANLDIAEKRLPQDGRLKIKLAGKETDVRVSTLPTQHGERVVLRLLARHEGLRSLESLGLRKDQVQIMRTFLSEPNGMMFIAGPTGSGKTSTLYAGLSEINAPDKNIVTVEDPVEYQLAGVGQIQVNSKIGLTFAAGLRSILRQDPDVVVVGETRDRETAQIAIEASLTGHLVMSTIHTNDAPSTITRLVEMGIEPFLVASSLRGVIAQRMVRKLHPHARVPRKTDLATRRLFEALPEHIRPAKITLFDPAPNAECPTGYTGRTGIFEVLPITDSIRRIIHARGSDEDIRSTAQAEGMLTLYQEGLLKAAKGETTLEEVIRVTRTGSDTAAPSVLEETA